MWRLLILLLVPALSLLAADPPGTSEWKFDVVHRKKGVPLRGLIIDQSARAVKIRCITRKPGSPTLVFTETVPRDEIAKLDLLDAATRKELTQRLASLKREREELEERLRALDPRERPGLRGMETLDFRPIEWPGDKEIRALGYQSTYFKLVANTSPELAQLAAIHLEQIYDAFARALPSRRDKATPTTVLLTRSLAEYQKIAKSRGLNLFNPAFYDPASNQVVCGSDLERLSDNLDKVRAYHSELQQTIKERRVELLKVYRGKVPAEMLAPLMEAENRIQATEKRNDATFTRIRDRLFRRLYHEAFHAYLNEFVYPEKELPLPLWFNEGLAQIFETAIVEVGELRVGHADPERLTAVRQAIARGTLLPLTDLLQSGARQFQVAIASDQQISDRYYLTAWALAYYLTFDRRILDTPAFDSYLKALKRGNDPLLAFSDLVGKPLPAFEKEFQSYLGRLRPDGTVGK